MKRRRRSPKKSGLYHFFIVLPDMLYPFATQVEGKWVRGLRSYERTVAYYERKYGRGHFGMRINCYRTFFHVAGAVIIIALSAFIANHFFGTKEAMYVMLGTATALISLQEFYYHPRYYHQLWHKSMLDWVAWVAPIGMYLFFWS